MIDPEVIAMRLDAIEGYVDELRHYQSLTFAEFKSNTRNYWSVEHGLQLAAQAVLDIAKHITGTDAGNTAKENRSMIEVLGEIGVLPPQFANTFAEMAGFRNIVVHEYLKVDLHKVYTILQNDLDDFILFAGYVNRWLESNFPSEPPE